MGNLLTFNGRLPGVVCEAALPPSREDPLRLDVAAFVGFAERGPLDLPVAVEDISQYQAVFGGDLLLARTRLGGQVVYAALHTAVKAFFDNGGRRCYVVRVAGSNARPNSFRIPGLVAWDSDQQTFKTVIAPAAWEGRWSDTMSIGTQLQNEPLHLASNPLSWMSNGTTNGLEIHLELPTSTKVRQNDLLRLQFDGPGKPFLFCFVETALKTGVAATTARGVPVTIKAIARPDFTFLKESSGSLPASDLVEWLTETGWAALSSPPVSSTLTGLGNSTLIRPANAAGAAQAGRKEKEYRLELPGPGAENIDIEVGDLLRVTCTNNDVLFFPVGDVVRPQQTLADASPPADTSPPFTSIPLQVISRGAFWQFPYYSSPPASPAPTGMSPPAQATSPPADMYGTLVEVDLLGFDLFIREGQAIQEAWQELRFNGALRFDGVLDNYWINILVPPQEVLQSDALQLDVSQRKVPGLDPTRSSRLRVPQFVSNSLADPANAPQLLFLPLGMGDLPGPDEFASALPDDLSMVIDTFCPLPSKDGLESFDPRELFLDKNLANVGVRDLINEANQLLYLNPNATHRINRFSANKGQANQLLYLNPNAMTGIYLQKLHSLLMIDEVGLISIPDLVQRPWHCLGPDTEPLPSPSSPPLPPDWSRFQDCYQPPGEPVETKPPALADLDLLPVLDDPETYDMTDLLAVQRAMVNLCAARADLVAILSLPLHFKRREVLEWQQRFTAGPGDFLDGSQFIAGIPTFIDDTTLSYAAVYHPWLQIREEVTPERAPLRAMPPNGAVCGMIAAREHARGPWIAPATLPLLGIVGLTPTFSVTEWADLFNAHINVVRQPTAEYTLLSAHTLSADTLFLQISVRRLLIFLRKLAIRRGMRYVFEPNNERFRQAVQASFENTLNILLARGAVTAFQVVTGPEINTQNDYDNGRFLIALKVAPTQPIEFITVILLRAGEGLLEALER